MRINSHYSCSEQTVSVKYGFGFLCRPLTEGEFSEEKLTGSSVFEHEKLPRYACTFLKELKAACLPRKSINLRNVSMGTFTGGVNITTRLIVTVWWGGGGGG